MIDGFYSFIVCFVILVSIYAPWNVSVVSPAQISSLSSTFVNTWYDKSDRREHTAVSSLR